MTEPRVAGTSSWDKYAKGYYPDSLSGEQKELIASFLERCPAEQVEEMRFPCEPREYFAARCLRARKYGLADALKLVDVTTAWRKEVNIKQLQSREASDILGCLEDELQFFYQKSYFACRDNDGRPVYVERGGTVDVEAMFMHTDIDRLVEYHTWQNEVQMVPLYAAASKTAGKPVTTLCAIVDMGGMSSKLSTATTRKYITSMIGIDSKHYPETLGRMFLINVPFIFSAAWMLIQPFLDERTQKKIEIISSESAWKKRLREVIDPAVLPAEYGGDCKVQVFPGSRTRKNTLAAGKSFHVATETFPKGAVVRFRWFCRPGDIGFQLHFVKGQRPSGGAGGAGAGAGAGSSAAAGSTESAPPPPAGSLSLYAAAAHPNSEKALVDVQGTAPEEGYFVGSWNNSQGWWNRDVFHRTDELVGGKPRAVGGLTSVTAAVGEGKPMQAVSAAPPPPAAAQEEAAASSAAGGGGGGGGGQ